MWYNLTRVRLHGFVGGIDAASFLRARCFAHTETLGAPSTLCPFHWRGGGTQLCTFLPSCLSFMPFFFFLWRRFLSTTIPWFGFCSGGGHTKTSLTACPWGTSWIETQFCFVFFVCFTSENTVPIKTWVLNSSWIQLNWRTSYFLTECFSLVKHR